MRTKPYDAYRPTGDKWLMRVPKHWEHLPLRRIGKFLKGTGGNKDDAQATGVPCIRYGDLYTAHQAFVREAVSRIAPSKVSQYTALETGDALLAASGETIEEIGKSAVNLLEDTAYCGGDVIVLRPERPMVSGYLGYALDCRPVTSQKSMGGRGITVMHVYSSHLKSVVLPVPPIEEQEAIARFLDHAMSRIGRYIRAKEKLVALLEERKRATINGAVTGQIDVRTGRPYRSYRRTDDAEWLGSVPSHWEIRRSKRVFRPRVELAQPGDIQLSATQAWGVISQAAYEKRIGRKVVRISQHLDKRRHVEVDDFVISMRSFQGGLERAWTRGCIRSSYVVLRPTAELSSDFFGLLFKSAAYVNALRSTADFIRDGQDLNFDNFCRVDLPFPSLDEQQRVALALQARLGTVTSLIEKSRREIALLREFRVRLIADVVTGKIDVRETAADPDEGTVADRIGVGRVTPDSRASQRGLAMEAGS